MNMHMLINLTSTAVRRTALAAALCGFAWHSSAQNTITNSLVAYWPMTSITGSTTPDVVGGYNLTLSGNGALPTIVAATNTPANTAAPTSCFLFNASKNESLFYLAQANDALPINKNIAYTVSFWVNANITNNANNVYAFAEDNNANGGIFPASSNPLWVGGMDSGSPPTDADMRFLLRNTSGLAAGGVAEAPTFQDTQGNSGTSNPVFDGNWHMVTISEDTNLDYAVYVDGRLDPGQGETDNLGNPTVLASRPPTNTDNNMPWSWDIDCTSFGALSRGTPGANAINGMVGLASMWTRTLGSNEVEYLFTNGLSTVSLPPGPPKINSFSADYTNVALNGTVTLRWNTANATDLSISPAPGDVLADSSFGVGSVVVTATSNTTYTLTASAPAKSSATGKVSVTTVAGVAPGWNLLQNFDQLAPDNINTGAGIAAENWASVTSDYTGDLGLFNVLTLGTPPNTNNVLGENPVTATNDNPAYSIEGCLAGLALNSETLTLGNSNTLFFRFYVDDANIDQSDIWFSLGFTWHALEPSPQDFQGGNGPNVTFKRSNGGIVDMASPNGVNNYNEGLTAQPYSAIVTNTGLQTATVYDVWMDVQVNPWTFPTNSDGTTNQLGDIYSVYIKPDSSAGAPFEVFSNYYSDVDYINSATAGAGWGQASTNLVNLFLSVVGGNISTAGTNNIVIDDLYMSQSGFLHTVPIPASYFPPPYQLAVNQGQSFYLASDPNNNNKPDFTLAWNSSLANYPNITYSVKRSTNLASKAATVVLTNGYPSGGASGAPAVITTFLDTSPPPTAAYYWVTSP
jgi:hypothetical protein